MEAARIKEILIGGRTNLFAVLDSVSVPDLPQRLYASGLPNFCLLAGELTPDVIHTAPYVVQLTSDNEFADWIFTESYGKHWGIFAQTLKSINEMRRHFRALLTVYDESGRPMLFRFYDPRVLRKFLPTCNGGELAALFGKIDFLYAEDEMNRSLLKFEIDSGNLKTTEVT